MKKKSNKRSTNNKTKKFSSTSRRRIKFDTDSDGKLINTEVDIIPDIPDPTDKETEVIDVMKKSFLLSDDVARGLARFERDIIFPRYRANGESEEEFPKEELENICHPLGRLHAIKNILPVYGLEEYEKEIMTHFIDRAFRKIPHPPRETVFRGDDESYLSHVTMMSNRE